MLIYTVVEVEVTVSVTTSLEDEKPLQKKSVARTYQPKWGQLYPRLRYDETSNRMTCDLCTTARMKNLFAQGGAGKPANKKWI